MIERERSDLRTVVEQQKREIERLKLKLDEKQSPVTSPNTFRVQILDIGCIGMGSNLPVDLPSIQIGGKSCSVGDIITIVNN